ncbi:asparaginase [Desulforhopalus singaporensis]|uniref:asparaginase n=1 Tax=Desulforhopalus singaporensis TaxID=91360 RepID=A0A1H0R312_9BACT|nr:asparaginase [Desulforhopalus singaporensis]SDP23378.1 L-asparaginase [Desulforhopalus singaporensis]
MINILILATGGTIVCSDHGQGLRPHYTVEDLLKRMQPDLLERNVVGKSVMNIDSSNMTPDAWLTIARQIVEASEDYDGFVITHGTDTMAYSSAALTYLLQGVDKPVVLTGAQYSMADSKTDALQNLHDALLLAGENISGVFIVFDGKVINGTRAIKTKTRSYDAFESVNYPLVAWIKHNRIKYTESVRRVFAKNQLSEEKRSNLKNLVSGLEENILVLKLFPGLHPKIFDFIRDNYKGVIIESYGTGGISTEILDLAGRVDKLVEDGIIVAITTQCLKEGVDLQVYEVGRKLPLEKIIYARDMNTDALVPKLMWAMGKTEVFAEIKNLVETPVRDDLIIAGNNHD